MLWYTVLTSYLLSRACFRLFFYSWKSGREWKWCK